MASFFLKFDKCMWANCARLVKWDTKIYTACRWHASKKSWVHKAAKSLWNIGENNRMSVLVKLYASLLPSMLSIPEISGVYVLGQWGNVYIFFNVGTHYCLNEVMFKLFSMLWPILYKCWILAIWVISTSFPCRHFVLDPN